MVALAFDKGVQDFNFPVIATNSAIAVVASWLAATATGAAVAMAFRRPLLKSSDLFFVSLPLLTLPVALALFALLSWLAWVGFGTTKDVPLFHRLGDFLSFFLVYGLISIFTPILFGLALLNQWAIRRALGHAS